MLVLAETQSHETTDPVMTSFLAFLAQDIARAPQDIRALDPTLAKRADKLTKGIAVSPEEDLGDEVSM
jgi:antitoxin PrlF